MLSVGIKELKDNPAILTRAAEDGELSILTKRENSAIGQSVLTGELPQTIRSICLCPYQKARSYQK